MKTFRPAVRTILAACLLTPALLIGSVPASAAIRSYTFSISGSGGEHGTGSFTWDDSIVPDGSELADDQGSLPAELLTVSITISGGNIVGGTTTFNRSDCTGAYLYDTPNFLRDINFWCDNGTNQLYGVEVKENQLNGGQSILRFFSNSASNAIPTLSAWGLIGLSGLFGLGAWIALKRRRAQPIG